MAENTVDGWITVFNSGTDYEAELVRDRLVDSGVPAVVLTHRDHAFNLTVGDLARVRVLVSPEHRVAALRILNTPPVSLEDLEAAALAADPTIEEDGSDDEEESD
ncbi:MAG: hypothetical protein IIA50_03190 [Bacteroidetes bacterium]|nr:hypothetical protein [Bacteroidota bacterium]